MLSRIVFLSLSIGVLLDSIRSGRTMLSHWFELDNLGKKKFKKMYCIRVCVCVHVCLCVYLCTILFYRSRNILVYLKFFFDFSDFPTFQNAFSVLHVNIYVSIYYLI